jgi:hypothetical protein
MIAADLPPDARAALDRARARPLSYGVRALAAPDGRVLVLIGETHLKLPAAHAVGRALVAAFDLRGVETFPRERVFAGRALGVLIEAPRRLLRLASFGFIRGSTITDARGATHGDTFLLESVAPIPLSLHVASAYLCALFTVTFAVLLLQPFVDELPPALTVPLWATALAFRYHSLALLPALVLRRFRWSWLLHPAIAILTARDLTMAEGTLAMLRAHPGPRAALDIMGRAHLGGYARALIAGHGFVEIGVE